MLLIFADIIALFEGSQEMIGISFVGIADAEIVDNQTENDWSGIMLPKARGDRHGVIAVGRKKLD
jgi:hypothetical protein